MVANSYTEQMENALFEQWDEFDVYNEDYSTLIEKLNSENSFRTFGDGLLFFLQMKNPDLTTDTAIKLLDKLCAERNVPIKEIASTRRRLINGLKNRDAVSAKTVCKEYQADRQNQYSQ